MKLSVSLATGPIIIGKCLMKAPQSPFTHLVN